MANRVEQYVIRNADGSRYIYYKTDKGNYYYYQRYTDRRGIEQTGRAIKINVNTYNLFKPCGELM